LRISGHLGKKVVCWEAVSKRGERQREMDLSALMAEIDEALATIIEVENGDGTYRLEYVGDEEDEPTGFILSIEVRKLEGEG